MRYFLDTEFMEDGQSIELISIGIVREDGAEYYRENSHARLSRANDWVKQNVIPELRGGSSAASPQIIRDDIKVFCFADDGPPEFWAYYGAYDWVAFCFLFGNMTYLPTGWPMYCNELKQLQADVGMLVLPDPLEPTHLAIADARWNKILYDALMERRDKQEQGVIRKMMGHE